MMIQINLVPDVKLELIKAQRHRNMVISSSIIVMIASAVTVVILGFVIGGQALYENTVTDKITKLDEKFRGMKDVDKMVTIQNQLKSIQSTHEQKVMSSRIFDLLAEASAKDTDNSVSLNSFSVDATNKTISLVAQTDKRGFDAAEVFRKNIEGMKMYYVDANSDTLPNEFKKEPETKRKDESNVKIASEVTLSDLSYSESDKDKRKTVSFRLTFNYDPLLFDETKDILRIRGIDRGNVTDSYKRLPQSLFDTTGTTSTGGQTR